MYKTSKETDDWTELTSIYTLMFQSFDAVNATFKVCVCFQSILLLFHHILYSAVLYSAAYIHTCTCTI